MWAANVLSEEEIIFGKIFKLFYLSSQTLYQLCDSKEKKMQNKNMLTNTTEWLFLRNKVWLPAC